TGSGSAATAAGSASAAGERKLWVMTRPSGARVFLGQRMLGRTPLRGMMIPVGNAVLVVRHAGYRSRRVDVDAAATPLQLDLKLTRKRPAAARGATLRIMTTHGGRPMWASVEVDGRGRGESPVVLKLASGTHRVRVSRAGYRAVARTVSLAPGAASRLVIELRK
ncbi:MAG: PEGA domain-containing protein, partial [Myxococcales bacterium]|nr:PEGA domain-containing protein [Myxococcales bacterium]